MQFDSGDHHRGLKGSEKGLRVQGGPVTQAAACSKYPGRGQVGGCLLTQQRLKGHRGIWEMAALGGYIYLYIISIPAPCVRRFSGVPRARATRVPNCCRDMRLHYGVRVRQMVVGQGQAVAFLSKFVVPSFLRADGQEVPSGFSLCVSLVYLTLNRTTLSISSRSRRRRVRQDLRHEVIYLSPLPWSYITVRRRDRSPASVRTQDPGPLSPKKGRHEEGTEHWVAGQAQQADRVRE